MHERSPNGLHFPAAAEADPQPTTESAPRSRAGSERRARWPREERDERGGPPPGLALDPPVDAAPPEHPPEIPVDRLDPDAIRVIARLRHMHHQAYFVGGCVRDLLVGMKPKDFDVATDAHPGEVRAIFRNCRLIGRRFRLAHVYFRGGKVIEVATFRKNPTDLAEDVGDAPEGDLLITRDNVFGTAEEDAVRRDFTVNGLFYDVATGEVIDYVGGRGDLESHRIATIGDPETRMREDPVRALRAVRFAARLGFTIAPDTFEAMRRHAGELARCAPARVLEEIFKLLRCAGSSRAFELLRACGALPVVLPALGAALEGWDAARRKAFFAHLAALDRLVKTGEPVSEAVLLGALLMHLGSEADGTRPDAEALLASLVQSARLPRKVAERTRLALHAQRLFREPPKKKRRRSRGLGGQDYFHDALQLLEISVDATGEGRDVLDRWLGLADAPGAGPAPERDGGRDEGAQGGGRERGPAREGRPRARAPARTHDAPHPRTHDAPHPRTEVRAESADADTGAPDDGEGPEIREVAITREAGEPGGAGAVAADGPGRKRRRRRGGRRRRRRGAGEQGPEGGATPPPTGAAS